MSNFWRNFFQLGDDVTTRILEVVVLYPRKPELRRSKTQTCEFMSPPRFYFNCFSF
ncbi:hypothetical protein HanIR_Chr10g0464011 [Helianthus annuus]|nr:hypothetical protein HanIR_Chr10g0464011 [Helianthus annuus]